MDVINTISSFVMGKMRCTIHEPTGAAILIHDIKEIIMSVSPLFLELIVTGAVNLKVGDPAPDFEAPATNGKTVKLSDCRGSWVVLYFYPKAFTPGCTAESCSLRDSYDDIQQMDAVILGVSLDDIETQKKFKDKHRFQFELLSDQDKNISEAFGVLGLMGMYAQRKTFIIDPDGKIAYIFDQVNTSKHDVEVKEILDRLQHKP
jgi:peroxiredoxin Q/BCP